MFIWLRTILWQLHHWDVALSYRLSLPTSPPSAGLRLWRLAVQVEAHLGDSWLWATVAALLMFLSRSAPPAGRARSRRHALTLLTILATTAGVVAAIKQIVQRKRPRAGKLLYGAGADVHSFPSGHAARLAAIAAWLTSVAPLWGWLAWPLAFVVGLGRVRLGIHYVGDVAAGYAVGGFTAWLAQRFLASMSATRNIK